MTFTTFLDRSVGHDAWRLQHCCSHRDMCCGAKQRASISAPWWRIPNLYDLRENETIGTKNIAIEVASNGYPYVTIRPPILGRSCQARPLARLMLWIHCLTSRFRLESTSFLLVSPAGVS